MVSEVVSTLLLLLLLLLFLLLLFSVGRRRVAEGFLRQPPPPPPPPPVAPRPCELWRLGQPARSEDPRTRPDGGACGPAAHRLCAWRRPGVDGVELCCAQRPRDSSRHGVCAPCSELTARRERRWVWDATAGRWGLAPSP